ncbi:MAG: hypothetical protein ACKOAB_02770, partial [Polynucleobacter victoriensis]
MTTFLYDKCPEPDNIDKRYPEHSPPLANHPQLVIYAKAVDGHDLVNGQAVAGASWVSIKEAKTAIQVEDLSEHMNELPAQMIADIEALWGGSPVIASAPDSVCQYCQA